MGTRARQVGVSNLHAGLWRAANGNIICVVCEGTTIPDGEDGEKFIAFSDAGLGLDGTVAVVGLGSNGSMGIYKDTGASSLTVIANKKVSVPGHSDCNFSSFPQVPSVDANGKTVFFGECNSQVGGVYSETSDYGTYGTLIDFDDKVDGFDPIYIGFGTNAVSGTTAAFYMVLDDSQESNGIWAFQVPSTDSVIA